MTYVQDKRILKVYFNSSENSEYNITVDGVKVGIKKNYFEFPQFYFEFETPVILHGSCSVRILIVKGDLTIVRCTATYPAITNDKVGWVTMEQPIKDPIALIEQNVLVTKKFPFTVSKDLHYQHLMFNGPKTFKIKCKQYYNNLYIGNVLDGDKHPEVYSIDPIYDYTPLPNDIYSGSDLEMLHNKVLAENLT